MAKLGIVAGGGLLPGQLIAACRRLGRDFHVLAVEGCADAAQLRGVPTDWIRVDSVSKALATAKRRQIEELVLVGNVPRPSPVQLMRDPKSAALLLKLGSRILGDNDLLSSVIRTLEDSEGFRIVSPEHLLKDDLAREGIHGEVEPDTACNADIERGLEVAAALGRLDIGQAAVVQNGTVIGVEAAEGTDRLIERCAPLLGRETPGGVLVKVSKPGQEQRVDLPAVGVTTLEKSGQAGLRGVAVEAERSWIVDKGATVAAADRLGLFLIGVPSSSIE